MTAAAAERIIGDGKLSGYDVTLTIQALEHRADSLDGLAKKNEGEGYAKEARIIRGDSQAIREHILPLYRPQQELALAGFEEVTAGIANNLRQFVRRARTKKMDDEDVLSGLSLRIHQFARQVAERAYAAGIAAREHDANVLMVRSLTGLIPGTVSGDDAT